MKGSNVKRLESRNQRLFIIQFLRSIKSFIKLRQKGSIVRNIISSKHLEFMLYIWEGKHWSSDHKPFSERKYIFSNISAFCEESCSARQHRIDWNLIESHVIIVTEMTQTLEKEMKGKFTSIDLKSLTPINICLTCKTLLTEEMINDGVAECASCNMISTDYNSLNLVSIVF